MTLALFRLQDDLKIANDLRVHAAPFGFRLLHQQFVERGWDTERNACFIRLRHQRDLHQPKRQQERSC